MNIRAGGEEIEIIDNKKNKYVQIEWVTTLPDLLAIYSMIILKTLTTGLHKHNSFADIL